MNKRVLSLQNPHWTDSRHEPLPATLKRQLYSRIRSRIDDRFMVLISGLRRVGKSTLAKQLIDDLIRTNRINDLRNLFIFSFENEDTTSLLPSKVLEETLDAYFSDVLATHPMRVETKTLIFLDELQNVSGWQAVIKRYYDLNPNFKFILTGSSSLFLREGAESLAGRILEYRLQPLSFREFLQFSESDIRLPETAEPFSWLSASTQTASIRDTTAIWCDGQNVGTTRRSY